MEAQEVTNNKSLRRCLCDCGNLLEYKLRQIKNTLLYLTGWGGTSEVPKRSKKVPNQSKKLPGRCSEVPSQRKKEAKPTFLVGGASSEVPNLSK